MTACVGRDDLTEVSPIMEGQTKNPCYNGNLTTLPGIKKAQPTLAKTFNRHIYRVEVNKY